MKFKVSLLIIAIVFAIILFGISTYMQKKLINYEATISCLVLTKDINENEMVEKDYFRNAEVPISLVAMQRVVTNFNEINGLYAKDNIKSGQIAIRSQFDTKENLSLYEVEEGKEKISIKIKSAENAISYQIKENSYVNVYATIRNGYGDALYKNKDFLTIGDDYDGYTVIKILDNVKILGTFSNDGIEYSKNENENMDTILIAVTPEEAKEINLIREIASFNVTGLDNKNNYSELDDAEVQVGNKDIIINEQSGENS